jgi:predicted amidohydrolase YtcJ
LRPGAAADFVILDRDPTAIPAEELGELEVVQSIIAGERSLA